MEKHAITFGLALLIIGFWGYYGDTGTKAEVNENQGGQIQEIDNNDQPVDPNRSLTALLFPGGVGLGMLLAGLLVLKTGARKHGMHVAAMLALLGAIAAWGRAVMVLMQDGKELPNMLLLMGVVCTLFVLLSIRSFRAAGEAREAEAEESESMEASEPEEETESAASSAIEAGEAEDDDGD